MRAVQITRFGGPEVMDVVDLPDPVPGDGEVLYEMSSSGVISLIHTSTCHRSSWKPRARVACRPSNTLAMSRDTVHMCPATSLRPGLWPVVQAWITE
jgi:hypothetical protein